MSIKHIFLRIIHNYKMTLILNIIPRVFTYLICFFLNTSSTYVFYSFPYIFSKEPFNWSHSCISLYLAVLTFVACISTFLGGILAAFLIRVSRLFVFSLLCLVSAIVLISINQNNHSTLLTGERNYYKNCSNLPSMGVGTVSFILYGIYYGLSKFILSVMLLDQTKSHFIGFTFAIYLLIINLGAFLVMILFQTLNLENINCAFISIPLILMSVILLIIGKLKNFIELDSSKLELERCFLNHLNDRLFQRRNSNVNLSSSIQKLCTLFICLLPYGICDSQIFSFSNMESYANQTNSKHIYFPLLINTLFIFIFIPLIAFIWLFNSWFRKLYSKRVIRILLSLLLMFLMTLSIGIKELKNDAIFYTSSLMFSYWNIVYTVLVMILVGISEILMYTTCGEYMYQQSYYNLKYVAMAFFLGAIGRGGTGDFISKLINFIKWHQFESKYSLINYTFLIWSGLMCLSMIFIGILLWKFKYFGMEVSQDQESIDEFEDLID